MTHSLMLFNMSVFACFCLAVSELLYALQWCKEVEYSPAVVSTYHSLLTNWGLSEGLHSQVPKKKLLEMLYSRWDSWLIFFSFCLFFLMKKCSLEEYVRVSRDKSVLHQHVMIFYIKRSNHLKQFPINILCIILLTCRSVEDGGLWSLTLDNYIHTSNYTNKNVRKLYDSVDR